MELGSEFHIDLSDKRITTDSIYEMLSKYKVFYTDYGRSAITLLLKEIKQKTGRQKVKVLLPSYICDSVIQPFVSENITFYELRENFELDEEKLVALMVSGEFDGGIFYLMHYFGMLQKKEMLHHLKELCQLHQITVIEDTSHSILTRERTIGDYCICSLREWMPIPEGAVIYSMHDLPENWQKLEHARPSYKINAMILKHFFLGGANGYSELTDENALHGMYRRIFIREEEQIEKEKMPHALSNLSEFLLHCENISEIKKFRRNNYQYLEQLLHRENISLFGGQQYRQNNQEEWVPFTALLRVTDFSRDQFRNYLMEQKIYCAVHWPIQTVEQLSHRNVLNWSEQLISLPIDQRYGEVHMQYVAEQIIKYIQK